MYHLFHLYWLMGKGMDGLWWPALSGHWLSCTGCCQYLLNMKYLMYGLLSLLLSPPSMFPPTDFLSGKRIGLVSMDLLYFISITLTYSTQDNQQEYFRLSNWFSLRCLGQWMNHLPPVWWSNFRLFFLNASWCVSLTFSIDVLLLSLSLYIAQMLPLLILLFGFTLT